MVSAPGSRIGRYRLDAEIGAGAMGIVYRAYDESLRRPVALKLMHARLTAGADADEFRARFDREVAVLAKIRSRHIVQVLDYGREGEDSYLVTELLPDGDLAALLQTRGVLAPEEALRLCAQVCDGLADAHRLGVVHRDVKPSNVLLWLRDGVPVPSLCDFGIASDGGDAGLTRTGALVGSLGYMAPERHLGGPADPSGDLYSVGCLLWACLSGRQPYVGTDFQVANGHINGDIPQLPGGMSREDGINQVLREAMAKDPAQRPATAAELRDRLLAVAEGRPLPALVVPDRSTDPNATRIRAATSAAPARPESTPGPTAGPTPGADPRRRRRGVLWGVAGGVAAVLVLGGTAYAVTAGGGSSDASHTSSPDPGTTTTPSAPAPAPVSPAGPQRPKATVTVSTASAPDDAGTAPADAAGAPPGGHPGGHHRRHRHPAPTPTSPAPTPPPAPAAPRVSTTSTWQTVGFHVAGTGPFQTWDATSKQWVATGAAFSRRTTRAGAAVCAYVRATRSANGLTSAGTATRACGRSWKPQTNLIRTGTCKARKDGTRCTRFRIRLYHWAPGSTHAVRVTVSPSGCRAAVCSQKVVVASSGVGYSPYFTVYGAKIVQASTGGVASARVRT